MEYLTDREVYKRQVQSRENKEGPFEGGTLVWNYGEDRLQILFDRIPEDNRRKAVSYTHLMLGHASTRMTQHYARVMNSSLKEAMNNVKERLAQ